MKRRTNIFLFFMRTNTYYVHINCSKYRIELFSIPNIFSIVHYSIQHILSLLLLDYGTYIVY